LSFHPKERHIPKAYEAQFSEIDGEASVEWINRDYSAVEELYRKELQYIQELEKKLGHPLHKGHPLHNIGMSLIPQNKMVDAVQYFALAYIEDALSEEENNEDEIDRGAAAVNLRDFYLIRLRVLGEIKRKALQIKISSRLGSVYDPREVLVETAKQLRIDADDVASQCRRVPKVIVGKQPLGFPQPPDRRVFIGGNYRDHMPILRKMASYVAGVGYTPIIADDVYMPEESIHQYTLMLLHTCCHAIFDVTPPDAGQFMEIERAPDYGIDMLIVWAANTLETAHNPPPWISRMIKSLRNEKKFEMKGYIDLNKQLHEIIEDFLKNPRKQSDK